MSLHRQFNPADCEINSNSCIFETLKDARAIHICCHFLRQPCSLEQSLFSGCFTAPLLHHTASTRTQDIANQDAIPKEHNYSTYKHLGWMSTPYGHKSLKRQTIKIIQQNMVLCNILFKDSIRIRDANMKHPASIQQLSHDYHDLFIPARHTYPSGIHYPTGSDFLSQDLCVSEHAHSVQMKTCQAPVAAFRTGLT